MQLPDLAVYLEGGRRLWNWCWAVAVSPAVHCILASEGQGGAWRAEDIVDSTCLCFLFLLEGGARCTGCLCSRAPNWGPGRQATQACALMGSQTSNLLVHRPASVH